MSKAIPLLFFVLSLFCLCPSASAYCGWLIKTKINEAINYFRDEASGYL